MDKINVLQNCCKVSIVSEAISQKYSSLCLQHSSPSWILIIESMYVEVKPHISGITYFNTCGAFQESLESHG